MTIRVHHLKISRSTRIIWLMEELGLPYELVQHTRGEDFRSPPSLYDVHPLGKAPAVEVDGRTMVESSAIIEYIVDRFGGGKLLDDLASVVSVDEKRVFACGMSNGGMMCYRLAAELSERASTVPSKPTSSTTVSKA